MFAQSDCITDCIANNSLPSGPAVNYSNRAVAFFIREISKIFTLSDNCFSVAKSQITGYTYAIWVSIVGLVIPTPE